MCADREKARLPEAVRRLVFFSHPTSLGHPGYFDPTPAGKGGKRPDGSFREGHVREREGIAEGERGSPRASG